MRILVLNYEYPPLGGGAAPVSQELAERMVSMGNTVEVVTMGFKDLPQSDTIKGVKIHRIQCWRSKINISHPWEQLSYLYQARKFLKKYLKENSFDVCHCHFLVPTGILAKWVKTNFKIPYIVTIHGSDVPGYNPHRFKFLHHFTGPIINGVIANSSMIASPSKYLKDLLQKKFDVANIKVIPNGIDTEKYESKTKQNIILSTGRLLERKGFLDLVKAVRSFDHNYELHICGDGPLMPELKKYAIRSRMKIHLHGWLDNASPQYQNLLKSAKIFSLVSTHENASISILEAMINGCAVISSNTTGCKEMVEDIGITIPPNDIEALQKSLVELMENDEKTHALGNAGRSKVMKSYDWSTIVHDYLTTLSSS